MSTNTHTRGGGTRENTNKLRVTTRNVGGFGLEVRSHKNCTKAGPKMQYLRKSAERNSTDVYVLTETRIKTAAECQNIGVYQVQGTRVILGGIYLDSSGTDQLGVQAIQQINGHIEELQ